MTLRKLAYLGHPILRQRAAPVADFGAADLCMLLQDMRETLADAGGVGLAAPQVYASLRVILVHPTREATADADAVVLINPEIEFLTESLEWGVEGCLSIPDYVGLVPRCPQIRYTAHDPSGTLITGEAKGFHARVLQHEVDHLDGILYPARLSDPLHLAHRSEARHLVACLDPSPQATS